MAVIPLNVVVVTFSAYIINQLHKNLHFVLCLAVEISEKQHSSCSLMPPNKQYTSDNMNRTRTGLKKTFHCDDLLFTAGCCC